MNFHGIGSRLSRPANWEGARNVKQTADRAETLLYLLNTSGQVETLTRALDESEANDIPLWLVLARNPKERMIGSISSNTIDLINRGLRAAPADILDGVIANEAVDALDGVIANLFASVVAHRHDELTNGIAFMSRVVEHAKKTHNTGTFVYERALAKMGRDLRLSRP
jgi:hypothetical protein